ncbi:hypothetical protein [Nocardia sp. NPDC051570]|uniref:hypothetical protein n=1 Tax=Nocardia sp. NPDC051570 TaxID=3364324 RepID=UPI0037AA8207
MGALAYRCGFSVFAWIFAAGCIGMIVLFFLPSAKEEGIDKAERIERAKRGNVVGASLTGLMVLIAIVAFATGMLSA